jgi:hypothetical protein
MYKYILSSFQILPMYKFLSEGIPHCLRFLCWQLLNISGQPAAIQQGHEHESREITVVGSHYLATHGEDREALMFRVVICRDSKPLKLLQLAVVTSYNCSINPIINPNPVSSY